MMPNDNSSMYARRKNSIILFPLLGSTLASVAYFYVGTSVYSILTIFVGIFLLFPLMPQFREACFWANKSAVLKLTFASIVYSVFVGGLRFFINGIDGMLIGDIYSLFLSFLFLLCGFSISCNPTFFTRSILFYALTISGVGVALQFFRGSGLELTTLYALESKNAVCVSWAIAGVICFWVLCFGGKTRILRLLSIGGLLLASTCILYARGRTAFVSMIFACLLILFKRFGNGRLWVGGLFLGIFTLIMGAYFYVFGLPELFVDSFMMNKKEGDLNSITSGRIDLLLGGWDAFISNFFWGAGDVLLDLRGTLIHNYPVRVLAMKGILGSLGFVCVYLALLKTLMENIFSKKTVKIEDLGIYLWSVLFVVSLGEPTQPFGPGTISAICYILLGMQQRHLCEKTLKLQVNQLCIQSSFIMHKRN